LAITVWDHPELTIPAGQFRSADAAGHLVADDGTIFYPYVGKVKVAGKTVQEVRRIITRRIANYIANPQLDVRVAAFRSQKVHIVGEVATPGPQPITDVPLTVVEAINRAGGLSDMADMLNVNITRDNVVNYVDVLALYEQGDTSQNILLQNGDILNVPDRNLQKVFVLGEVSKPSSLLVHKGRLTLAEAISDVGGVNPRSSNPAKIFVMRGSPGEPEIYHLDGKSPDSMVLADRFPLFPRDVVYIETAAITNWSRVINQLLPTFRSFDILTPP
jgi:polysaccharide export outer membrane protein